MNENDDPRPAVEFLLAILGSSLEPDFYHCRRSGGCVGL
ncbi:hypothetical protein L838_0998 [Mycobacterium avium MAV_120709_2344]|nr:hypothetical protein L838_0998 [Mycobacterium avium MAV_120709_2344]